jgi:hypothetical protein
MIAMITTTTTTMNPSSSSIACTRALSINTDRRTSVTPSLRASPTKRRAPSDRRRRGRLLVVVVNVHDGGTRDR